MSTTPQRPTRDPGGGARAPEVAGTAGPGGPRESAGGDPLADWRGPSAALAAFRGALEKVARGDATVLLTGESGSGKSRAAEALHRLGPRRAGPLVSVHLGALGASLIESELFGHEQGAFTDARRARLGRFRQAEGGTLVLDDVDLLPPALQVKLLRVLQERRVEPLGAEGDVAIDVRIVATTARDLPAEVDAGRFRQDLYWRLAVVPLEVPPLRARAEDLEGLVEVLSRRTAERLGRAPLPLGPGALERLLAHPWPGNVRELENALERVQALAPPETARLEPEAFDFLREGLTDAPRRVARAALAAGLTAENLEAALLEEALELERGNQSAAARRVGLSRRAFEYRLGRLRGGQGAEADENGAERPGEPGS